LSGPGKLAGLHLLADARKAAKGGERAMAVRQRQRLAAMVTHARTRSPYYRHLYRGLPDPVDDVTCLPVTGKAELMAAFDDWVTDPAITLAAARAFAEDPARVGEPFAGRYTLTTTSGTTGTHGIFLQDAASLTVVGAMMTRMLGSWLTVRDVVRMVRAGVRMALIVPEGGHFGSTVAAARMRGRRRVAAFSVHQPLDDLVDELNAFRPAILAPYASVGALLAGQAETGRLRINPALTILTAEELPLPEYTRIAAALGGMVRTSYAANECPFLSAGCAHGWLHLNADWAILEPVDEHHRPVAPGEPSHTVLLSNLANRVQPILRYDLGDAVLVRPDACPCGRPGPAIRVQGRAADLLTFPAPSGQVSCAPLVLATALEAVPGLELFQIVQSAPAALSIRLLPAPGTEADALWQQVETRLRWLLDRHGLDHVDLHRAAEPPQHSKGGKVRAIMPLPAKASTSTPHTGRTR